MSPDVPEIDALEETVVRADTLTGEKWTGDMVRWSDAESAVRSALDRQARETACDRCGDELRDHPGLRPVCGVCMLGTTEDDLYQQARRDVAREIVEALRAEARGRTPHADRDARVIAGIREGADLIEHVFLSPDNPEGNA